MYKICLIGGHFTTAYATLQKLLSPEFGFKNEEIIFFGKKFEFGKLSEEYKAITEANIKFIEIKSVKFNRFFSFKNFVGILFFPFTVLSAMFLLLRYRPKVVVGFGGYLSLPICISAKILRDKILIHEGTVRAGFSNKLIGRFADKILISFESSRFFFKNPVLTGCPLREEIVSAKKIESKIPLIFICGGHLGSQAINKNVFPVVERLLNSFIVVHQTGRRDINFGLNLKKNLPVHLRMKYEVADFVGLDNYANYLINSSLIISRAGINTVCEILYLHKKAIFIPLPFAQHNEQYENARLAKNVKIAEIIEQKDLSPEILLDTVGKMSRRELLTSSNPYQDELQKASSRVAREIGRIINV